jgi:hypothetical protein
MIYLKKIKEMARQSYLSIDWNDFINKEARGSR